ncbi:hypothetical protein HMPREF1043_1969 [Streptococcus anginosus subsp. whileyi CCUG 39159]|uniref:Uncharacterized protein n=1 Tax=Streptococcus anginosus subsp. whileyi CCUG 39159 TaxID=1095729 RepID=I0SD31_STRAP|nr:hypothetical protein HMPREF1043_1969 [Streptococcus anginosus subsp. whileyi CCUG 39159]
MGDYLLIYANDCSQAQHEVVIFENQIQKINWKRFSQKIA